ncbi:MAG TPA: efflux RND transporter periplasmic adaptor subunit [Coriobacteriia bacterium]
MIAAVVVVVLVAGFLVWSVVGKKGSATQYVTAQPTRGTLTVAVAGNGSVVSQNSASVNPPISGTVTQLTVSVGQKVKKGEVLFVIDNPSLDANVTQAKSSYQQAKSSTLKAAQAETQADVSLETGVLQAKQALQQAKGQVAGARASLAKAKAAVPFDQNAADQAQDSLDAANTGLKTAQENYEHACTIQKQGHAAAQESYNAAVTAQSASYMNYQQSITNAGQRTVTSPIDGYVTTLAINNGDQIGSGSSSSGTSRSSAGGSSSSSSSSSSNTTPIVISDLSSLQAQVQIAETDRPKVKIGQKVEVTFDAVTGLTITGHVAQIDAVGTASSGVVTYNVTITFDVQDKRLNPGMTASASIITQVDTNVLLVPNAAIKTDTTGASYVQVLSAPGATPTDVTVQVGPAGDTQTEIVSGLTGNENVVTQTISSATTGSSSSRSGLSVLGGGAARGAGGGAGFRGGN